MLLSKNKARKGLPIDFLVQMVEEQNGKCAISGVKLTRIQGRGQVATNASIDRIVAGGAYSKDNVRLVCSFVNTWRGAVKTSELIWWCKKIVNADRQRNRYT